MTKKKRLTFSNIIKYKKHPLLLDEIDPEEDKMDMKYIEDEITDYRRHRGYNE